MDRGGIAESVVADDNASFFEYEIPMVSSDGESHALLTMVAVCSGLVGAIIVLLVLIVLIDCHPSNRRVPSKHNKKRSVFTVFGKRQSLDITDPVFVVATPSDMHKGAAQLPQFGYVNERFSFDETVFASNGKLAGISTVSC